MEAWRMMADESFGALLQRTTTVAEQVDSATVHIHHLEHRQPPPLPPPPLPQAFPQPHVYPAGLDLNLAPHPSPHTFEVDSDRPSGHQPTQDHRVLGGGILGPPPRPVMGMPTGTEFHSHGYDSSYSSHSPPFLKFEFPKFYGDNPWLWRDQCLMYFEVYGIHESLKTRFAALNFKGTAATWL